MGLCGSKQSLSPEELAQQRAEKDRSKELEAKMSGDHEADSRILKLLLLGAGESGKSTLFKQMIQIYGKGFPESERKTYTGIIFNNIITSMKTLIQQSENYTAVTPENEDNKRLVDELKGDEEINEAMGAALAALWKDEGIQATYEQRSNYQLNDSTQYFLDRIHVISAPGYIPTEQDVLRSRVRTTGIVENDFEIDNNKFKMFDVGGQRNERKKWIHCFESVTAVIFVAAISEYDQMLYEDENTNRMVEALNLFEEICNSRWFKDTSMILFLNKRDLFTEKIARVPLKEYFPEYTGEGDPESSANFLRDQFLMRNRSTEKEIYAHVVCATDTGNIAAVFNAVKDIIIKKSLQDAGLMM